jgi:anti-sigma regulatory factor (Ser/Thr protein kinase)
MQLGIALHEALANALYHGNLELDSELRQFDDERPFYREAIRRRSEPPYRDRKITVDSRVGRAAARFTITDEGPGFETALASRPLEADDLNRIGGKGLLLIKAFVDRVTFNDRGNQIELELDLTKPPQARAHANR